MVTSHDYIGAVCKYRRSVFWGDTLMKYLLNISHFLLYDTEEVDLEIIFIHNVFIEVLVGIYVMLISICFNEI